MHHRVLQRQMKKFGISLDQPPRDQEVWNHFLERVDRFYHEADQGRYLLEQSLAISSREMQELYDDLRKASESRIAAERDKLRAVISSLGAGLCTLDVAGCVLSINPEGERLLGCTEADVLGQPFWAWRTASGDGQVRRAACSLEEVIASGLPCREEDGVFVRKDGTFLPVSYTLNPIREDGVLQGAVLVFFDITERKQAGEALRESEERHRTLLNQLPVGVYRTAPGGQFLKANPAMAELFGVDDAGTLQGLNARNFFLHPEDRDRYVEQLMQDGTITEDFAMRRQDGTVFWVRDYARAITDETDGSIFFDGILVDITERKEAKEVAQRRTKLLGLAQEIAQLGSWEWDVASGTIQWSDELYRIFGLPVGSEIDWDAIRETAIHPDDREMLSQRLDASRVGPDVDLPPLEYRILRPDGSERSVWGNNVVFFDEDQKPVRMVCAIQDVTERKQAEEALRASEQRFRTLAENVPGVIYLCNNDERYSMLYLNDAVEVLTGYPKADFLTDRISFTELYHPDDAPAVPRQVDEALAARKAFHLTYRIRHRSGEWRWVEERGVGVFEGETLLYLEGFLHDITERKQAEEALRESEERLRAFVDALPGLALILDEEGRYVEIFTTQEPLLYDEAAQLKGRRLHDVLPEAAADLFLETIHQAIGSGAPTTLEYELEVLSGKRWFEGQVAPMPGIDGERRMVVWISHDITERKRAEEALRESEQRFRDLFESSPDAIFVEDFDGNVLDVNPAACRLHHTDAERLVGRNVRALVPPKLREEAMEAFAQLVKGEVDQLESASWTADGQEIPVEIRVSRITQDQHPALLLQVRDITRRRQAEQRLRMLEASVSASIDGITISDVHQPDYPLIYVSPGFERMTGYRADEVLGRNCRFLQNDDRDQPALDEIRKALKAETQCRVVLRNYRKDGALFWNELTMYPLHDAAGRLTHYVGIQRDVTGRKQVEDALRQSEERYTLAVSAGNVGVWDWNLETNEIYIDSILKQILGYEDHEIKNELDDWGRYVHPDDGEKVMEAATAHLEGKAPVYEVEHRMLHRGGGIRWFVARGTAMRDVEGKPVRMVGTDTDVTERKLAEQELARINAKLEQRNRELQDFAHVASHDLQEPLRKIRAFADLMQEDYSENVDETGKYYLDRMQDAAKRMAGLITDLLVYSRVTTKVRPFGKVDLNAVVADVISDLEMQIQETGGRITVSTLPTIDADSTQMHRLLQNFIANALKFHKPGEAPVVEVSGVLEKHPARNGADTRAMCRLEVRDNGIGFDEKYLDRIFTPFQRLHGRGSYAGTGMGLAICRRIVERHHGTITAHSTPGEGAQFVVMLPVQQPPVSSENDAG